MKKRALITGITGQDGSHLADLLLNKDYEVIGLARRSTHYQYENIQHLIGKIILEFGDLIDSETIGNLIATYRPDEIYNIAAQSVPADSWKQPITTAEVTGIAPIRMMEAILKHKPDAKFYQATSREIYGGIPREVIDESAPVSANNPYGVAKLYAHLMVSTYRQSYGIFACGGILFNHEGPRRSLHFVTRKVSMAAACIKLGMTELPLDEFGRSLVVAGKVKLGNLDAVRDWGYAKEYVEAMWLMLQQGEPQDYVIATNTIHTVRELCEVAFSHLRLQWEDHVETASELLRPTEIAASRGDFTKARQELGWYPKTYFEDLVRLMVDADVKRLSHR
jgi:GDPmannose 4,6-dehydratase